SKLAFDGSGTVKRGRGISENASYSVCQFQNGKMYNCDLNASYNIAARYFVREILKSLSETARLATLAKVPECAKRTTCTLSSLFRLNAVLYA
ncbi:MAG: transposase, partial [Solobacterium sp.]|nr:transposase [Solobacterium sp.]